MQEVRYLASYPSPSYVQSLLCTPSNFSPVTIEARPARENRNAQPRCCPFPQGYGGEPEDPDWPIPSTDEATRARPAEQACAQPSRQRGRRCLSGKSRPRRPSRRGEGRSRPRGRRARARACRSHASGGQRAPPSTRTLSHPVRTARRFRSYLYRRRAHDVGFCSERFPYPSTFDGAIGRGEPDAIRLGPRGQFRVPVDAAARWASSCMDFDRARDLPGCRGLFACRAHRSGNDGCGVCRVRLHPSAIESMRHAAAWGTGMDSARAGLLEGTFKSQASHQVATMTDRR